MAKVNTYNQDEDLQVKINKTHIDKAKKYITPYKTEFIKVLIILLLASVATMSGPFIVKIALDEKIPNKDINGLLMLGGIYLITVLVAVYAQGFRMKSMNKVGQGIIYDIRKDLFAHLQKLPFTYFDSRPHGKILVRVVNYVNSLADMFSNGIVNAIMELVNVAIILVFMFLTDVQLTLASLLGLPILVFTIVKIKGKHRKAWQDYSNKNSNLNAYLHESINGIRITQAFVREKRNRRIFGRLSSDSMVAWMKAKLIEIMLTPIVNTISEFTVCLIFFIGVATLTKRNLSVGVIMAIINYIWRFWSPIASLSNIYNSLMTNAAYLERIFETMDEDVVIKDTKTAYELPAVEGIVEYKNVYFGYDKDRYVLKDLSFKMQKGETVALVGHTGAGKTTLVNMLCRYYDIQAGQILIDGHDIKNVTLKSLREQIGYMMQDSFIFSGTIMENIRYGKLDATDNEVILAAKSVNAHDFIDKLPSKYNTYVSERGSTLSAGQRQLISLARVMLKNPAILILDEATSSIDTETEKKLMEGIDVLLKNRTSFIIAHRLSTIVGADRIFVLGKEGINEAGSHSELMAKKGEYYKFYTTQNTLAGDTAKKRPAYAK